MKKSLIVSTIIGFIASFERSDIAILQEMGYEVHIACNCDIFSSREKLKRLEDMKIIKHHISFARIEYCSQETRCYLFQPSQGFQEETVKVFCWKICRCL